MKIDIHGYKGKVERLKKRLETLDTVNRKDILEFEKQISAEGLTDGRIMKYLFSLRTMALMMKNPEIKKLVRWHDNYVVFVTPEAKELGWDENTLVVVKPFKTKTESKLEIKKVELKT